MTFNKANVRRDWLIWLLSAWLGVLGAAEPAVNEPAPIPPPSPVAPEAAPAQPAPQAKPAPRAPRVRLQDVVSVGGSARVQSDEQADNVIVVAGDADVEGAVKGDVVVVFGHLRLRGSVNGDVIVVAGDAEIDGKVSGDIVLPFSPARIGPAADLRGEIICVGAPPEVDASAKLRHSPEVITLGPLMNLFAWGRDYLVQGVIWFRPFPPRVGWAWAMAGAFLVFHLALALILGGTMRSCMRILREQPARSFLVGLLACLLVGPVSVLLGFTIVALPLIWLVFLAFCTFGRVAVYGAVGAGLGRAGSSGAGMHPVPAVLIGSVIFYACYMVPIMGFVAYFLVVPWGVGACLIRLFEALRREGSPGGSGPMTEFRSLGMPPMSPPPPPPGAGPGPGSTGVVPDGASAAAAALASGWPGPATHAQVGSEPPPISSAPPPPAMDPPLTPPRPVFPDHEAALLSRVGCGPRFGAALIDILLLAVINGVLLSGQLRVFWILLAVYHLVMWGWRGTTLGGTILGLKVVRLDGRPMDWSTAVVRVLGSILSLVPLGLGFLWASWDAQFQSWHDRIAGTTVVRSERPMPLV